MTLLLQHTLFSARPQPSLRTLLCTGRRGGTSLTPRLHTTGQYSIYLQSAALILPIPRVGGRSPWRFTAVLAARSGAVGGSRET